jgi:hypothetical protein
MKKQLLPIRIMMFVAALLCWSHTAAAGTPRTETAAASAKTEDSKAALSITDDTQKCLNGCVEKMKSASEHQCVTVDAYKDCLKTSPGCFGLEWKQSSLDAIVNSCQTWGERMCGCGSAVHATAAGSGTQAAAEPAKPKPAAPVDPAADCQKRGGVWITVPGPNGDTHYCWTIADAHKEIKELRALIEKGGPFTAVEIDRLKRIASIEPTDKIPQTYGWKGDLNTIARGLEAICRLTAEEETKVRAEVEAKGGKYSLVVACEVVRDKIRQAEEDAKKALAAANEAKDLSKDNQDRIEETRKAAGHALIESQQAKEAVQGWSLFRVSAMGGMYFWRTPRDRVARTGDELQFFYGIEGAWLPRLTGGPHGVRLVLSAHAGLSNKFYGSTSGLIGLGLGLGVNLVPDLVGSVRAVAEHFSLDNEFSKANFYGGALGLDWFPGLSKKTSGGIVPAISLTIPIGVSRFGINHKIVEQPNAGVWVGLGIAF